MMLNPAAISGNYRPSQDPGKQKWIDEALKSAQFKRQLPRYIAYNLVRECAKLQDLDLGKRVQFVLVENGLDIVPVLADHLIRLFASCENLPEANLAFTRVSKPSKYTWHSVMDSHVKLGEGRIAFSFFDSIEIKGIKADKFILNSILKACISIGCIEHGRYIHQHIIENEYQDDVFASNILLDMYAKSGSLDEAEKVFGSLRGPDVVSWGGMISGYALNGKGDLAFICFHKMELHGIKPNRVIFLSLLKASASIAALEHSRYIHECIIQNGLVCDTVLGNTVVDVYGKLDSLKEAQSTFQMLQNPDVISWAVMIAGYGQHGESDFAIKCFKKMQDSGVKPSKVTFLNVLKASIGIIPICQGRVIHEQIIESRFQTDIAVQCILVDMYAKSNSLQEAQGLFNISINRNAILWGAIIAGCLQHDKYDAAFEYFEQMQANAIKPDRVTYLGILKACTSIQDIVRGRCIHEQILVHGLHSEVAVRNTLADMYVKSGSLKEAKGVFDALQTRNVVSWNVIISGCAQHDEGCLALEYFKKMQHDQIEADEITFSSILKACGNIGAIEHGRQFHQQIIKSAFHTGSILGYSLVDMYVKCGSITEACKVFDGLQDQDLGSWGAMLAGYAQLGNAGSTVQCFRDMQKGGVTPDDIAYGSILTSFSHMGLVEESLWYFRTMKEFHGIRANVLHVACILGSLGRSGRFKEAESVLEVSAQSHILLYIILLNACRLHKNVELGTRCFHAIIHLGR